MIQLTKTLCLVVVAILFSNRETIAQGGPPVPVTPTASAISKAINYPVNLNTGLPGISIPLGKVEAGGNLVLPVQLSYHGGGFKINERSGSIGLGWSISTDLQITRTINGIDDFGVGGYINNTDIYPYDNTANGAFTYSRIKNFRLANGERDGMPDKFNYKLINKSGSFYFQKNAAGYTIVSVPCDNIRIEFADNRFIITDTDGTVYYFGNAGLGWSADQIDDLGYELTNDVTITSWRCMRIVDYTGNNYINFSYEKKPVETFFAPEDKVELYNNPDPCPLTGLFGEGLYVPASYNPNVQNLFSNLLSAAQKFYRLPSPKTIEYFNGAPKYFTLISKNQTTAAVEKKTYSYNEGSGSTRINGLALSSISFRGSSVSFSGNPLNTGVFFYNKGGGIVRSVVFTQSQVVRPMGGDATCYLDEVKITGSSPTYSPEKYTLLYRNKAYFGSYLKGHDAWGYRNAQTMDVDYAANFGSAGLTPLNVITQNYFPVVSGGCATAQPGFEFPLGNNDVNEYPDETYMAYGMLKRMILPSGGFVDFDFEANKYHHNSDGFKPLLYAGGLRIQKITFYDGITPVNKPSSQKYYVYGDLETGEGIAAGKPELIFGYSTFKYGTLKYTQNIIHGEAQNYSIPAPGKEFTYIQVPCSTSACLVIRAIENKTTYMPSSALDLSYSGGSPIYYNKVTEYQQDYGISTGKTVTEFYPYGAFGGENLPVIPQGIITGTDIRYLGVDWHVGAIKSVANYKYSAGKYILQTRKDYEYTKYKLPVMPRVVYCFLKNIWQINSSMMNFYTDANFDPGVYGSFPIGVNDDFIAGQYGIPVGKLLLSKETETVRDEQTATLLVNSTDYFYEKLPYLQPSRIVTTDSKQQLITKFLTYPYDYPASNVCNQMVAGNIIEPVIEERLTKGAEELSRKVTEYSVVSGQSFVKPFTVKNSVYGGDLHTQATFSSYDGYGNLQEYTGRDGVVQSAVYGYDAMYPVASLKGISYQSVPSGILTSPVLNNPSSDQQLRDLLEPLYGLTGSNMVTVYTHKPLLGVSSITEPNRRKTFYDYDAAGRLSLIKDEAGNILKKNELVYAEPPAGAYDLFYVNRPMMGTYNNAYCNPAFVDEPTSSGQYPRNYIMPGGSQVWGGGNGAPVEIEVDGATDNGSNCVGSGNYATIRLNTFLFVTIPDAVYVDFLQDGHVFATFKFMYVPGNTQIREIHLPAGNYQVSFRPRANYKGNLLKYRFYNPANQVNYWAETGSTLTISNGLTYELEAVNISGASYPFLP